MIKSQNSLMLVSKAAKGRLETQRSCRGWWGPEGLFAHSTVFPKIVTASEILFKIYIKNDENYHQAKERNGKVNRLSWEALRKTLRTGVVCVQSRRLGGSVQVGRASGDGRTSRQVPERRAGGRCGLDFLSSEPRQLMLTLLWRVVCIVS